MRESHSILEIVFDILSCSGNPLSAEQIANAARQAGYELTEGDVEQEIDDHLRRFGYRSPLTEIGRVRYGLIPDPAQGNPARLDFAALRPLAVGLAILFVIAFALIPSALKIPEAITAVVSQADSPVIEPKSVGDPSSSLEWWAANAVNQINPETQEVARQYLRNSYNTCGPAVVAMLSSFYRAPLLGEEGRISTARVLRDAKRKLGYYNPPYNSGLLTFDHLREMLSLYGVEQAYPGGGDELMSLEELLEGVRQGKPAIVGMRYGYQADGWRYLPAGGSGIYNHFVIVFGVTVVDGQELLWLYNPHPAKYSYNDEDAAPVTISIAEFVSSWALNDGSENAERGHAVFFQMQPE